ncbi:hypothetical protein JQ559_05260 [Bradyrhizobium viridifuturi]|jgi:hypothetical protein|uniref:hypothetical protein n=1 Tax=Bradyrhizobium TaxID=374 RepID=UPI000555F174|nr:MULTISPECIES: hypothetical protein [Bradyrhizobium]OYU62842.1 MAG: hypothetical protein CFE30_08515 [Bradyrhizobium sp. PARBB1]PSO22157.1 hypothetical protein C7G43_27725 [Bradyrhizobium sp. MOS004]QRI70660.1 hypothetical protein JQ507_03735 [Bradyrhizobium sp. PSBB068]MBR1023741.1 hypothetical protein [Bradyrhizobium viridifuturi]MBR1041012.1 hypothetical protein [Bradyrhizobium viridifuturi]
MAADRTKLRADVVIASTLVVAGVAVAVLSLQAINASSPQELAQAAQPLQPSPAPPKTAPPAESRPGGERPTTPAPEPARPDAEAQKAGAKPVLPPAPAEKTAPPIEKK